MARGRPKGSSRETIAKRAAIVAYHNRGERTLQEVGNHFGVSREYVRQVVNLAGITTRLGNPVDYARHVERLERYKAALQPGVRAHDAATSLGVTLSHVVQSANALGVKLPRPKSKAKLRYEEIAAMYRADPTLTGHALARHFGVDDNTISRALRISGVVSRRSGWKCNARTEAGHFYVATSDKSDLVKIGFTLDPKHRMRSLRGPDGEQLRIVATTPGTMQDELALHDTLREHRAVEGRNEFYPRSILSHPAIPAELRSVA